MNKKNSRFITKSNFDYSTKLKKLEEEKQHLIQQRKEEIFTLIEKTGCLSVDNELLAGALELLKEISALLDKGSELPESLISIETLIRGKSPIFFRRKQRTKSS